MKQHYLALLLIIGCVSGASPALARGGESSHHEGIEHEEHHEDDHEDGHQRRGGRMDGEDKKAEQEHRKSPHHMTKEALEAEKEAFKASLSDEQKKIVEQARILVESGDKETAHKILKDANIVPPIMKRNEQHQAIRQAVQNGDFTAFQEASKDSPLAGKITEEQFNGIKEVRELALAGDKEEAKALAQELGIRYLAPWKTKQFAEKLKNLTEEQKVILKEAHVLSASGDKEGAKELITQAGIELPKKGIFEKIRSFFGPKETQE